MTMMSHPILRLSGTYIAFIVGAAFSTGQEALQFFAAYGLWGLIGLVVFVVQAAYIAVTLLLLGKRHQLKTGEAVFEHFLGKKLGQVFTLYVTLVAFLIFIVMLAGSGAVIGNAIGWPKWMGSGAMALAALVTVYLGLRELVAVISRVGPLLIVAILAVSIVTALGSLDTVTAGHDYAINHDLLRAQPTWWAAGIIYAAMFTPLLYAFLAPVSDADHSDRTLICAGILGPLLTATALAAVVLALMTDMAGLAHQDLPLILLAEQLWAPLGAAYTGILVLGIFSTATPMVWIALSRFAEDGSARYRGLAVLLVIIAYGAGQLLSFRELVHLIFPTVGYAGLILLVGLLIKQVREKRLA